MSFPDDIVIEIFSWLPVKPLMRFRCLSKTWLLRLSSDPDFINLHTARSSDKSIHNKNPNIIFFRRGNEKDRFYHAESYTTRCNEANGIEIPFINLHADVNICNGLLCMAGYNHVIVWNPLMNDKIIISYPVNPKFPAQFKRYVSELERSNRSSDNIVFGFGYCKDVHEYKVMRFHTTSVRDEFYSSVSVYTIGTGAWRNLEGQNNILTDVWRGVEDGEEHTWRNLGFMKASNTFVNGAFHLYASHGRSLYHKILAFDLKDESFREIPQPEGVICKKPHCRVLKEFGGCLSIVYRFLYKGFQIWKMKQYGFVDSWTLQFKLEQRELLEMDYYLEPLGFASHGEIITAKNGCMIIYNTKTNSVTDQNLFEFKVDDLCNYTPSLISPTFVSGAKRMQDIEENKRNMKI